jgi:hypothetical protein
MGVTWALGVVLFIWGNPQLADARLIVLSAGGVDIHYEASLKNAARQAAEIYRQAKTQLEAFFGWKYEVTSTVILLKNSHDFNRLSGHSYIVALAVPPKNLIIIDYSKMNDTPFSFEKTMKHEICHLMLHHHIRNSRLPKWLDEGIAQWVSDGMMELLMDSRRRSLGDAILAGNHIPLADLRYRFPRDRQLLWLAYEESKSMVAYMEGQYGKAGVLDVLNRLKSGQDLETALLEGLGISFEELESNWRHQLKQPAHFFAFLATYIYEALFFLAAILTIAGFVRFLIKKRAYQDEDEDDVGD